MTHDIVSSDKNFLCSAGRFLNKTVNKLCYFNYINKDKYLMMALLVSVDASSVRINVELSLEDVLAQRNEENWFE